MRTDPEISLTAISPVDAIDEAGAAVKHISDRLVAVVDRTAGKAASVARTWSTTYAAASAAGLVAALALLDASPVLWCLAAVPMAMGWMPSAQGARGSWYGVVVLACLAVLLAMVLAPAMRLVSDNELPVDAPLILGAFLAAGALSFALAGPLVRACWSGLGASDRAGVVLGYRLIGLQTIIISLAAAS